MKTFQASNKWWLLTIQFRDNIYEIQIDLWGRPVRSVPLMLTCSRMRAKQWRLSGWMLRDRHLHRSTELNIYNLLLTNTVAHLPHSCPKRTGKRSHQQDQSFCLWSDIQSIETTFALLIHHLKNITKIKLHYILYKKRLMCFPKKYHEILFSLLLTILLLNPEWIMGCFQIDTVFQSYKQIENSCVIVISRNIWAINERNACNNTAQLMKTREILIYICMYACVYVCMGSSSHVYYKYNKWQH